jgi:hypothetical protein
MISGALFKPKHITFLKSNTMFYEQNQFKQITVSNIDYAATLIMSGLAREHQALHWQQDGKDFFCVPDGTQEDPFTDLAIFEKKGCVFMHIENLSIWWMRASSVLVLHLFNTTRQPAAKKPSRLIVTTP